VAAALREAIAIAEAQGAAAFAQHAVALLGSAAATRYLSQPEADSRAEPTAPNTGADP